MDARALLPWPLPLYFDTERAGKREKRVRSTVADQPKQEARLLCAACRQLVTYPIHRITLNGSHEHCCTNPQGVSYRIGCFRQASGCSAMGEAFIEFTWFPGYAWRVGVCAGCQAHLGWRFETAGDHFYGLILDRLVLEQPHAGDSAGR
jgi:hypothetical protein